MPNLNADEIVTQKHKRAFIQYGGALPTKATQYAGQDAQYISITGVTLPELGAINPIYRRHHQRADQYRLVGRTIDTPGLPTATVMMNELHGVIPRQLQKNNCKFNLYEVTGVCEDLSDFLNGWSDYVLIYSSALVNEKDLGDRVTYEGDDAIDDSLSATLADIYPIGKLGFGEKAATQIDREVADVVYASPVSCSCDEGTEFIYAVTKSSGAGSPGLPAEVIYSVDAGANWSQVNIDGIGAAEDPLAIDIVGKYLVVLGADAYFYAEINSKTGVPGTFTEVTTGFVGAGSPTDIYVANAREIYFCGDGGYLYKSTDITAGVTVLDAGSATANDLNRIHGVEEIIVAVGDTGTVVKSTNRGVSFATTTASPDAAATLQALWVLDDDRYWVGTSGGAAYYTLDGGETWTSKAFSGSGTGAVRDIVFVNDEVGYIAHNTEAPAARLFSTWNGGRDWTNSDPRILNLPTFDYVGRIAFPDPSGAGSGIAANNVALAGLSGNGTDGILFIGAAARI